ncbi:RNA helicase [uncultured Christiangramia sp.]|uniref:RNA helicase n=1 Tax=uncultured Christiangramia sp. TaxID=503836 RepID=UPI0026336388|nr:RNA helicase [uncultured Christiangramia sp.]
MRKQKENNPKQENSLKKCGIIMPIAAHPDYPKEHWKEVLLILLEAINETEFEPRMVNEDSAIGLIHERIVNNIYSDDIIICDVSSKNPNVMFELGMRLAFDKPTIIIKDEKTGYSFDTGVIEHINYPSSLRFNKIVEFKEELISRINATYKKSTTHKDYSPFLKSFGKTIIPAKINPSEIAESKYILEKLEILSQEMKHLRMDQRNKMAKSRFATIFSDKDRQNLVQEEINQFLTNNSHLEREHIMQNFIEILREEVVNNRGFKPYNIEIINAVNSFFESSNPKSKLN